MIKGLALRKRNDLVELGMDDQSRLVPGSDLVKVSESLFFLEAYCIRVYSKKPQKRAGIGKAAFYDEAAHPVFVMACKLQSRSAAKRSSDGNEGACAPLVLKPFHGEFEDLVAVPHHSRDRGTSCGPAVPAIVHGQKIDAHAVIE